MAKRTPAPKSLYVTSKLVFDHTWYLKVIREPEWVRRPLRFPFVQDRGYANIDFSSEMERRTYYGQVPKPGPREGQGAIYGQYTTRESFDYASGPNRFINRTTYYTLPDNYVATTSGLYPLAEGQIHPDYLKPPIGNYEYVTNGQSNQGITSQEMWIASYPFKLYSEPEYTPVHDPDQRIPRVLNQNYVTPSYQAPVYPKTHSRSRRVPAMWTKFSK